MLKIAIALLLNACAPPTTVPAENPCLEVECELGLVCDAGACVEPCGDDVCAEDEACVNHEESLPDGGYQSWWACEPA